MIDRRKSLIDGNLKSLIYWLIQPLGQHLTAFSNVKNLFVTVLIQSDVYLIKCLINHHFWIRIPLFTTSYLINPKTKRLRRTPCCPYEVKAESFQLNRSQNPPASRVLAPSPSIGGAVFPCPVFAISLEGISVHQATDLRSDASISSDFRIPS